MLEQVDRVQPPVLDDALAGKVRPSSRRPGRSSGALDDVAPPDAGEAPAPAAGEKPISGEAGEG